MRGGQYVCMCFWVWTHQYDAGLIDCYHDCLQGFRNHLQVQHLLVLFVAVIFQLQTCSSSSLPVLGLAA